MKTSLVNSSLTDVDELATQYNTTLKSLLDKHAPETEKRVTHRPDTSWFSEDVHEEKRKKHHAERVWRHTRLEVHRQLYKSARNRYNKAVKSAKSDFIVNSLSTSDPRRLYSIVNNLLGKKEASSVLPELDEKTAADTLSSFSDKITKINDELQVLKSTISSVETTSPSFIGSPLNKFIPVTNDQLQEIILKSNKTFSPNVDPVPTKLALEFLDILLPVMVNIINISLATGIVPTCFKRAVVQPLIKKAGLDPSACKNFRPVSNLPFISKLLERIVVEQLVQHLSSHNCLDKFQSAYRPEFSTETVLLRVLNDALSSLDSGKLSLLVLLDLSAAFDTINHALLLQRLANEVGVRGVAHRWFLSYLTDRSQYVVVGSSASGDKELTCGVPQGPVLGPILFSLYTSQPGRIIEKFSVQRQFFADDSQLQSHFLPDPATAAAAVANLESCCTAVKCWMSQNMLKLNDDKTEAILLGPRSRREKANIKEILIGDAKIPFAESVRDLGLIVDAELTMVPHINKVTKNCFYSLRILGKLRPFLSLPAANSIALALVMSRVDYCNSALWGLPVSQISRLQRIQNTAARIVSRTKATDHITPVLKALHWLPVQQRIDHKVLSLAYCCIHNTAPTYLKELIPVYQPARNLRSASSLRLRLPSTDDTSKKRHGARSFKNAAPKLWNSLPETVKEAVSITAFRKRLKTYLFSAARQ
nr:hypothetical protein BaRGS_008435 [Batillaria attramentaria]